MYACPLGKTHMEISIRFIITFFSLFTNDAMIRSYKAHNNCKIIILNRISILRKAHNYRLSNVNGPFYDRIFYHVHFRLFSHDRFYVRIPFHGLFLLCGLERKEKFNFKNRQMIDFYSRLQRRRERER